MTCYSNGYGHSNCYPNRHHRKKFRTNCLSQPVFRWRNRRFKDQIRSSVSLAKVPNNAKLDYLKLHLTGRALAFFLEIPTADRRTSDKAIQALENRCLTAIVPACRTSKISLSFILFASQPKTSDGPVVKVKTECAHKAGWQRK